MAEYHFSKISKINSFFVLKHIKEKKKFNPTKKRHILCDENKNYKRLLKVFFLMDIEFSKILGKFKQKNICRFIHDMQFQVIHLH
jgi:hypothetical protein